MMIRAIEEAWSYKQIGAAYEHTTRRVAQTFITLATPRQLRSGGFTHVELA